jgi:hypothetical protein
MEELTRLIEMLDGYGLCVTDSIMVQDRLADLAKNTVTGRFIVNAIDHMASLPDEDMTADGIPVHSGMLLYEIQVDYDDKASSTVREIDGVRIDTFPDSACISECYSTRADALQAIEEGRV